MKRILLLVAVLISVCAIGQGTQPPINQTFGSPNSTTLIKGVGAADSVFYLRYSFPDTTSANRWYLKNIPGAQIRVGDTVYMRNNAATKWQNMMRGGGGGATGGGNTNSNVGSGYRLAIPNTNDIKTLGANYGIILDSATSNQIGIKADTATLFPAVRATIPGGAVPVDSLTGWALNFDYLKGHNVNHGQFWPYTDSFYLFLNEAWICPDSASGGWTGYYVSAGYGGDHAFLGGVESGSNGWYLTGNVYTGTGSILDATWTGYDVLPNNTLHYVSVGYDGTQIVCYVDGVPSGKLAFTGYRKGPNGSDPVWFTGGSDHNNFNGKILRIRHFEDDLPIPIGYWYYPKWTFDGAEPNTVFNSDYTVPSNIIEDNSPGFWGVKHPGIRNSIAPVEKPFANIQNSVNTAIDGRPDSLLPQWTKFTFAKPTYTGGSPTIPPSAIIYDSYMREDVTPAWTYLPALDSTEGGTAGKKKYNFFSNSGSGILNMQAWITRSGGAGNYLYVDAGVSDQDIKVSQTIGDKKAGVIGRFTDNNNYIYTEVSGTTMYIVKKVGGVTTVLDTYTTALGFTVLRLVLSGGNWSVYEDATLKASGVSIGDVPLGTKCGWSTIGFYTRVKKFEVY